MKRIILLVAIASLMSTVVISDALAQGRMQRTGGGCYGAGPQRVRLYNPANLETINGEVIRVNPTPSSRRGYGVHLLVKANQETIDVHLGPTWYLDNQNFNIQPGDRLEIRGSRVTLAGTPAMIATEVKKGNNVLTLRNERGIPVWSGRGLR